MRKIKNLFLIGFGAFLGITFPEQITAAADYVYNVDYASLFMSAKTFAIDAYMWAEGLINGGEAAA